MPPDAGAALYPTYILWAGAASQPWPGLQVFRFPSGGDCGMSELRRRMSSPKSLLHAGWGEAKVQRCSMTQGWGLVDIEAQRSGLTFRIHPDPSNNVLVCFCPIHSLMGSLKDNPCPKLQERIHISPHRSPYFLSIHKVDAILLGHTHTPPTALLGSFILTQETLLAMYINTVL